MRDCVFPQPLRIKLSNFGNMQPGPGLAPPPLLRPVRPMSAAGSSTDTELTAPMSASERYPGAVMAERARTAARLATLAAQAAQESADQARHIAEMVRTSARQLREQYGY